MHDVSEIAGLATHSFGEEDVDRHIQVLTKILQTQKTVNWIEGVEERIQSLWGRAGSLEKGGGVGPGI